MRNFVIKSIVPINKLEVQYRLGDVSRFTENRYNIRSLISSGPCCEYDNLYVIFDDQERSRHTEINLPLLERRGYNIVVLTDALAPEGNFDLIVTLN